MDENKKEEVKKTSSGGKKSTLIIVIGIILIFMVGAGFLYTKVIRGAKNKILSTILSRGTNQNIKVDADDEGVTLKGDDYEISVNEGGKLSENFPSDFPVYKGAVIKTQAETKGEEGSGMTVMWETEDEVAKVSEYYKKEFAGSNWKIESSYEAEGSVVYNLTKGEENAFLSITSAEDKTQIMFTTGSE